MRTNRDKIAQICRIHWIAISEAEINDYPGIDFISISGTWKNIPFNEADFKEDQSGSGKLIKQEFSVSITGLNQEEEEKLKKAVSTHILIRIDYSNSISKVVGNENVPVKLSMEIGGSPSVYTLSFKRFSPEFSKYLKSF